MVGYGEVILKMPHQAMGMRCATKHLARERPDRESLLFQKSDGPNSGQGWAGTIVALGLSRVVKLLVTAVRFVDNSQEAPHDGIHLCRPEKGFSTSFSKDSCE